MNMMPGSMNQGQPHPIQGGQPMQGIQHVMHSGQAMGVPLQGSMGGHPMHMGGNVSIQQPTGVMVGQQPSHVHMQNRPGSSMGAGQGGMSTSTAASAAMSEDVNPLTENLSLIVRLKELFYQCVSSRAVLYNVNLETASSGRIKDSNITLATCKKIDKEIYEILDRIERNFSLIEEMMKEQELSRRHFPFNVQETPTQNAGPDAVPYNQYAGIVAAQIKFAKEIRESLEKWGKAVNEHKSLPPPWTE